MTLPVYPSGIRYQVVRNTWSVLPGVPPLQTDMGGGNLRRRKLPGSDVKIMTFKILLPIADWSTLSSFIDNDLGGGTSRFTMNVWTGSEYESKTVQFMDDYPHPSDSGMLSVLLDIKLRVYAV